MTSPKLSPTTASPAPVTQPAPAVVQPPRAPVTAPPPARVAATLRWAGYLVVAGLALFAALVVAGKGFLDLQVYRDAGRAYLDGTPLFGEEFRSAAGLRFIYGPIAAVIFVPFTVMPDVAARFVWTAISVVLLWWVLRTVSARLGMAQASLTGLALLAPAMLLGPVRETLSYGQINIVMMALVVLDAAGVIPRRFRGVGIGVAAAIKVTPAAFGLLLLVRKDLPSVVRAAGAFLLVGALGFLAAPGDSVKYWTTVFFDTNRGGPPLYGPNQAVTGLLARLGLSGSSRELVWVGAVIFIVAAAAYAARLFTVAGDHLPALGVVALASLLAAPLAVAHHWVYVVLLLALMLAPQYAAWRYPLGVVAAVFYLSLYDYVPVGGDNEANWGVLQQLLGNSETLAGLALLGAAVVAARSRSAMVGAPATEPETAVR